MINAAGFFSQRDERWRSIPLGMGGGHTLGSAGCLVSAAAGMLVEKFGEDTDPGRLNRWLARNDGFVSGNLVVFGALEQITDIGGQVIDCRLRPAPMGTVRNVLDAGGGVLALVDFVPGGGVNQHWVEVLGLTEDDAWIHDPWLPPGQTLYWMMPRYGHWTWNGPARAIFRLAFYHRDGDVLNKAVRGPEFNTLETSQAAEAMQGAVFVRAE